MFSVCSFLLGSAQVLPERFNHSTQFDMKPQLAQQGCQCVGFPFYWWSVTLGLPVSRSKKKLWIHVIDNPEFSTEMESFMQKVLSYTGENATRTTKKDRSYSATIY